MSARIKPRRQQEPELPPALTVDEAAKVLRMCRNTCYQRIREGVIPAVRVGRKLLVPRTGLLKVLDAPAGLQPAGSEESLPIPGLRTG